MDVQSSQLARPIKAHAMVMTAGYLKARRMPPHTAAGPLACCLLPYMRSVCFRLFQLLVA